MNKKISIGITISLMAITAALTFILTFNFSMNMFNKKVSSVTQREEFYTTLSEIDSYVRSNYEGEIDEEALLEAISRGYVTGISDEYAEFYAADEYDEVVRLEEGYTVGFGMTVVEDESGYMRIDGIDDEGAAFAAGLKKGDIIVAVNNKDIKAIGYSEAAKALNAAEGVSVIFTVRSGGEDTEYAVTSKQTTVVSVSGMLIDGIGYIRIDEINNATPEQFKVQLDSMMASGAKGLVFDVRGTNGESVQATERMLNFLIAEGDVLYADYRGTEKVIAVSTGSYTITLPMAVLIDTGTGGCAEAFAAVLHDCAGAKLIGTNSMGKADLLTVFRCKDGSTIRFTVAKMYTALTKFDDVGLMPDYAASLAPGYVIGGKLSDDTQYAKAVEVISPAIDGAEAAEQGN